MRSYSMIMISEQPLFFSLIMISSDLQINYIKAMQSEYPLNIPQEFICPLTKKIMTDPVIIETGRTFEKEALLIYFQNHNLVDPITQQILESPTVFNNLALSSLIEKQWVLQNKTMKNSVNKYNVQEQQKKIESLEQKIQELNEQKQAILNSIKTKDQGIDKIKEIIKDLEKPNKKQVMVLSHPPKTRLSIQKYSLQSQKSKLIKPQIDISAYWYDNAIDSLKQAGFSSETRWLRVNIEDVRNMGFQGKKLVNSAVTNPLMLEYILLITQLQQIQQCEDVSNVELRVKIEQIRRIWFVLLGYFIRVFRCIQINNSSVKYFCDQGVINTIMQGWQVQKKLRCTQDDHSRVNIKKLRGQTKNNTDVTNLTFPDRNQCGSIRVSIADNPARKYQNKPASKFGEYLCQVGRSLEKLELHIRHKLFSNKFFTNLAYHLYAIQHLQITIISQKGHWYDDKNNWVEVLKRLKKQGKKLWVEE